MCFNLKSSIISFSIGTLTGLYLFITKENELKTIGLFIVIVTLIQLVEALIYYYENKNYRAFTKILSILLSLQGIGLMMANNIFNQTKTSLIWVIFFLFISLNVIILSLAKSFKNPDKFTCMNWDFIGLNKVLSKFLAIMYISLFIWMFTRDSPIYRKYGLLLLLTFIYSYTIQTKDNSPSVWCLTSAIASPIVFFLV